jgi:hypothetical protein
LPISVNSLKPNLANDDRHVAGVASDPLTPWRVHDATFIFTQNFRLATLAARLLKRVLRGGKVLEMSAPALSVG